jgi:hypothetical protein
MQDTAFDPSYTLTLAFAAALLAHTWLKFWLASRQIRHVAAHREAVPPLFAASISLAAHHKAADYTIAKTRFGLLDLAWGVALTLGWTLLSGLSALERDTDLVILDTGAGVNPSVLGFVAAADCTLVVATPEPTSIADAYALIKCRTLSESAPRPGAPGVTAPPLMLVANQVQGEDEAIAIHRRVALVAQRFLSLGLPLAGWIAADPRVPESIRAREPLTLRSPRSAAARDIRTLAQTLAPRLGVKVTAQPSEPTSLVGRWFGRAR